MKYRVNRPLIKQHAKIHYFKNWTTFLLAGLILVAINLLLTSVRTHFLPQLTVTIPAEVLSDSASMTLWMEGWLADTLAALTGNFWTILILVSLLDLLVMVPLQFGFYQLCWNTTNSEQAPKASSVFSWITDVRKVCGSIGMYLLTGIFTWLWALLFCLPAIAVILVMLWAPIYSSAVMALLLGLVYILLLAGVIAAMVRTVRYQAAQFCYAGRPELGIRGALREVRQLLKGRSWEFFVLYLSFILWHLASSLTYGVGDLFVTPYFCMTVILFLSAVKHGPVPPVSGEAPPVNPGPPEDTDDHDSF